MRYLGHWPQTFAAALLVALLPQGALAATGAFGDYSPAEIYSEHTSSTLYLPMRDGVRIAVRVTRPARDGQPAPGRFPVI